METGKKILIALLIVIPMLVTLGLSIDFVPAGYRGVTTHWSAIDLGEIPRTEGIQFKVPFQDNIVKMSVKTQKYPEPSGQIDSDAGDEDHKGFRIASTSNDLQDVFTEVVLQYHINGDSASKLYKNVGIDYDNVLIQPLLKQSAKEVMAKYKAEELVRNRETLRISMEDNLNNRLFNAEHCIGCIVLESVSITDLDFTKEFSLAIEAKVTAIQKAEEAVNDLERIKVEAQQALAEAEGQANAIREIEQALSESPNYIQWLATKNWNGQLPYVTGQGATPFISIPEPNR